MEFLSTAHCHTTFCDGKSTAREMVMAAIENNFYSIGFSGHAPMEAIGDWCMSYEREKEYVKEVLALKDEFENQIDIVLGIEFDATSVCDLSKYSYVIGSVHENYNKTTGKTCVLDYTKEMLMDGIENSFSSFNDFLESYCEIFINMTKNNKIDIIGHIDLFTKFNEDGTCFDESDKKYQDIMKGLAFELRDYVFEMNTGAISRGYRTAPYPNDFILKQIIEQGSKIIVNSDSHSHKNLCNDYDICCDMLRKHGVDTTVIITSNGFKECKI